MKAVRKAKDEPLVYDKREQAFVFEARCTQDEASDYFRRLWNAGTGLRQVITEVQMPCALMIQRGGTLDMNSLGEYDL